MKLKPNDVVCFLGDSITCAGWWEAELFQKVAKHGVKIYNCGVSGNRSFTAFSRIYEDCLIYNPTVVVVTLGINDVMCGTGNRKDPKIAQSIENAITTYADYMERIIKTVIASGATVVLGDPVPYDEQDGYDVPSVDCNCDLDRCREILYGYAKKYRLEIIPFNQDMKTALKTQKVIADRVHPNMLGYKQMAKTVERFFDVEVDESDEFNFSPVSQARIDAEQYFKDLCYIEYDWVAYRSYIEQKPYSREDKLALAKKLTNDSNPYCSKTAKLYLEADADLRVARAKLIEKTVELYDYYNSNDKE